MSNADKTTVQPSASEVAAGALGSEPLGGHDHCHACGKAWVDHVGISGTCEKLMAAESVVRHITGQRANLAKELAECRILLSELDDALAARMATQGEGDTIFKLWEAHKKVREYLNPQNTEVKHK